jgi:hypothetical protein
MCTPCGVGSLLALLFYLVYHCKHAQDSCERVRCTSGSVSIAGVSRSGTIATYTAAILCVTQRQGKNLESTTRHEISRQRKHAEIVSVEHFLFKIAVAEFFKQIKKY